MSKKHPQQQIFDTIFICSLELGYTTVDYLPAEDFELPFVYLGEQFMQQHKNKSSLYGRVQQTVHIYSNRRNRRDLTDMMLALEQKVRSTKRTENFFITVKEFNSQILTDVETGLLHGILEFDIQFH